MALIRLIDVTTPSVVELVAKHGTRSNSTQLQLSNVALAVSIQQYFVALFPSHVKGAEMTSVSRKDDSLFKQRECFPYQEEMTFFPKGDELLFKRR
jgi:hypothetical protein